MMCDEEELLGPEQVRHVTAPADAALAACLEGLLPPGVDARGLIDIGAVYVDRVRCVLGAVRAAPMPDASKDLTDGAEPSPARVIIIVSPEPRPAPTICPSRRAPT
jgi:hypothetical protein